MNRPLDRYTWDQATIAGLATARGFTVYGIPPATIRKWASRRHITASGKAPGGAHLYHIPTVLRHARRQVVENRHMHVSHFATDGPTMSDTPPRP